MKAKRKLGLISLGLEREFLLNEREFIKGKKLLSLEELSKEEKKELIKDIFFIQIENAGYDEEEAREEEEKFLSITNLKESEKYFIHIDTLFGDDREYFIYEKEGNDEN